MTRNSFEYVLELNLFILTWLTSESSEFSLFSTRPRPDSLVPYLYISK